MLNCAFAQMKFISRRVAMAYDEREQLRHKHSCIKCKLHADYSEFCVPTTCSPTVRHTHIIKSK